VAFVLVLSGLIMIVTGAKGTYAQFGNQVASDFTGPGNFTYWLAAIGSVGALGYVDALRTISRMFLALILIAMVLANKGFFNQLTAALKSGPIAPESGTGAPATNQASSGTGTAGADGRTLKESSRNRAAAVFGHTLEFPRPLEIRS
jgi:hypothetical protein